MFPVYHRTPLTSDGLHLAFHLKERPIAGREMRAANAVLDDGTSPAVGSLIRCQHCNEVLYNFRPYNDGYMAQSIHQPPQEQL